MRACPCPVAYTRMVRAQCKQCYEAGDSKNKNLRGREKEKQDNYCRHGDNQARQGNCPHFETGIGKLCPTLAFNEFLKVQLGVRCTQVCPWSLISPYPKGERDPQQFSVRTHSTAYTLLTFPRGFHMSFEDSDGLRVKQWRQPPPSPNIEAMIRKAAESRGRSSTPARRSIPFRARTPRRAQSNPLKQLKNRDSGC